MLHFFAQGQSQKPIRHTRLLEWLLVLWATSLALLNPLACFIHCEILHAHDTDTYAHSSFFVCDMTNSTTSTTFTNNLVMELPHVPLPVYPGLMTILAGLMVFFAIQHRIVTQPSVLVSYVLFVKSPPPKHMSLV
jgi:hypothetical protein